MQPIQQALEGIQGSLRVSPTSQKKPENKCTICHGTTWVPAGIENRVKRCECQKRKIYEGRIRVVLEDWPEYASADLWEMKGIKGVGQANALTTMRENPRGSYFLTGYYNRGKTHLLVAQYRHIALLGERCIIRSARDLMDELRKAEIPPQSDKDVFESAVLQMVNMAPTGHLFIDDIDKITARSEFRLEALFDLFDTIKRRQLGLTVTSNIPLISNSQSIQDLRNILGNNAVSRLDRICRVIDL